MKKCSKCGVENKNSAVVCIECGAPLGGVSTTAETASASSEAMDVPGFGQQGNGQMYVAQPVYDQQSQKANAGAMAKAVASLILGIAGLIISCMAPFLEGIPAVLGLLISIIGIVFAVKARNGIPVNYPGRGVATAGMVFSILGIIIGGLFTLVFVCVVVGILTCVCSTPTGSIDYYTIMLPFVF